MMDDAGAGLDGCSRDGLERPYPKMRSATQEEPVRALLSETRVVWALDLQSCTPHAKSHIGRHGLRGAECKRGGLGGWFGQPRRPDGGVLVQVVDQNLHSGACRRRDNEGGDTFRALVIRSAGDIQHRTERCAFE